MINTKTIVSIVGICLFSIILGKTTLLLNIIIGLSFLVLYFGLILYSLKITRSLDILKDNKKDTTLMIFVLLIGLLFIFSIMEKTVNVYYWDYSREWVNNNHYASIIFEKPLYIINELFYSINNYDYNILINVVLAIPVLLLGNTYTVYIVAMFIFLYIPTNIVITLIIYKIANKLQCKNVKLYIISCGILMFPALLIPILHGYADIICVLWFSLLVLIILDFDICKVNKMKCIMFSINIILLIITRRYFVYLGIAITLGFLIRIAISLIITSDVNRRKILVKNSFINLFIITFTCIIILLTFFRGFIINGLTNTFSIQYSAYKNGDLLSNIKFGVEWFGLIIVVLLLIGIFLGIYKSGIRKYTIMLSISMIISFVMFFGIQSLGMHHYYIIIPQIIILSSITLLYTYKYKKKIFYIVSGCLILNFSVAFNFVPINNTQYNILFNKIHYKPIVRNDMKELQLLSNEAIRLAGNEGKVVVLSSSDILNDSLLYNLYLPNEANYFHNLSFSSQVDLRDGFSDGIIDADIIIATNPPQTHLIPGSQRVIEFFNNELINNGKLSDDFELYNKYNLDGGVTAMIYRRVHEFDNSDIQYMLDYFNKFYIDYPQLFNDRIIKHYK